jgi:4-amino-4-deoxy-L-arabinose transferase-like glycosyltransferase
MTRWPLALLLLAWIAAVPLDFPRAYRDAGYERQGQSALVSRAVLRDGWPAVWQPRGDFLAEDRLDAAGFVIRYEFPFHGLITWPLYRVFGVAEWVERIAPLAMALVGLLLVAKAGAALGGSPGAGAFAAAVLGTAPLYAHLGRVPMPDIFATVLVLASFLAAWQRRTALSAGLFAAACLAKANLAVFGLPVLGALLLRDDGALERPWPWRRALGWCALAGVPFAAWVGAAVFDPPGSWSIVQQATADVHDGFPGDLVQPLFYVSVGAYLTAFGIGVGGVVACVAAGVYRPRGRVFVALVLAGASTVVSAVLGPRFFWREPQYVLPVIVFLALAAACGWPGLKAAWQRHRAWRLALAALAVAHVAATAWFLRDLKGDRVPDQPAIAAMARHVPPEGRVAALGITWGAAPADWMRRKVWAIEGDRPLRGDLLARLRAAGFTHVLVFETTQRAGFLGGRRWTDERSNRPAQMAALEADFPLVERSGRAALYDLR